MRKVAQSRQKRLAHYLDPKNVPLDPTDAVDAEDSRTELFGQDADEILHEKEAEINIERVQSGIKPNRMTVMPTSPDGGRRR